MALRLILRYFPSSVVLELLESSNFVSVFVGGLLPSLSCCTVVDVTSNFPFVFPAGSFPTELSPGFSTLIGSSMNRLSRLTLRTRVPLTSPTFPSWSSHLSSHPSLVSTATAPSVPSKARPPAPPSSPASQPHGPTS